MLAGKTKTFSCLLLFFSDRVYLVCSVLFEMLSECRDSCDWDMEIHKQLIQNMALTGLWATLQTTVSMSCKYTPLSILYIFPSGDPRRSIGHFLWLSIREVKQLFSSALSLWDLCCFTVSSAHFFNPPTPPFPLTLSPIVFFLSNCTNLPVLSLHSAEPMSSFLHILPGRIGLLFSFLLFNC